MDTADEVGLMLIALAVLIVVPVLLYPPIKAWIDRRNHELRMSREWREAPQGMKPKTVSKRRSRAT
jgi:hypothetical protein